ncbi:MAG TPA: DUF4157 domain-containing protein, partial [Kofleriaceae bacterium]
MSQDQKASANSTTQPVAASQPTSQTPGTAGVATQMVHALLSRGERSPDAIVQVLRARPHELREVAAMLHGTLGNSVVQAVMRALGVSAAPASAKPAMAKSEIGRVTDANEAQTFGALSASAGAPLPADIAATMGATIGHAVGHVVIHTDSIADHAARQIGARAFTIGHEIYFAAGAYAPHDADGARLLIHELTHVAQHDRGALTDVAAGESRVSKPSDGHEHEATAMEARAASVDQASAQPTTHSRSTADRAPVLRAVHGINNEGNDCFMSAVLQLLATSYRSLFNPETHVVAELDRPLQRAINDKLVAIRGDVPPAYKRGDTKDLRAVLMNAKIIESEARQEDAAEVLRKLLQRMTAAGHDRAEHSYDRQVTQKYEAGDAKPSEKQPGSGASRYDADRKSTTRDNDLSMVNVEMSEYDSFEQFMGHRYGAGIAITLDAENAHHAYDHEGGAIDITKRHETMAFARLPNVMTFVVNRFDHTGKLSRTFPMPSTMVLKQSDPARFCTYEVRAMVVHDGSQHGGHYTAEVRDGGAWSTANDGIVTPHAKPEPRRSDAGYIYTYHRTATEEVAPPIGAVQDTVPVAQRVTADNEAKHGTSTATPAHRPVSSGEPAKRGLPNEGRGDDGKSDCFINAIVQLAAGPYRAQFDPSKNDRKSDPEVSNIQSIVWRLIGSIHKLDKTAPAKSADILALREALIAKNVIKSKNGFEDASEVLIALLGMMHDPKAPAPMVTQPQRTLELEGATKAEVKPDAAEYRGGASEQAPEQNTGYLPVDVRQFSNLHQFLYRRYGAGGERTTYDTADRPQVRNDHEGLSVGAAVEHTAVPKLPSQLTFQLQRAQQDAERRAEPDLRPFYMPPSIELVEQGKAKSYVTYQLRGVVTWHAAHFTSRVCHEGRWFDFDDDKVRQTQGVGDVLTGGYLYTYVETARKPEASSATMQEHAPRAGIAKLDDELAINYDSNAIIHTPTQTDLRMLLHRIAGLYPVLSMPARVTAVLKAQAVIDRFGMLTTSDVSPESEIGRQVLTCKRELATALGVATLAEAAAGKLPVVPDAEHACEPRGPQATKPLVRKVADAGTDLATLNVAEIRKAIAERRLDAPDSDAELHAYIQYRARKEFYEGVHLVYDLDQTLITYTNTTYRPPAVGQVSGTLGLDETHPIPIHGVVAKDTNTSAIQPHFTQGKGGGWRQRPEPKTARHRGETGPTLDERGSAGDSRTGGAQRVPSNQKESEVRAMSIRPGSIAALDELDGYGVHQSVWTHNSQHHMHRVLEMLDTHGFGEHRFDQTMTGKPADAKEGQHKPLEAMKPDPDQTTVLLDDQPRRGNHELGALGAPSFAPLGHERTGELQVPAWDPTKLATKADETNLEQLLGDRLMVKLALAQVNRGPEPDDPRAREFLDAMKALVSPRTKIEDSELLEALDEFLKRDGAKAAMRKDFQRFEPRPPPAVDPHADPSMFALTPSLAPSGILPTKPDSAVSEDSTPEKEASKRYKGANVINRGAIRTEVIGEKRFVRVYQTEANALSRAAATSKDNIYKDVHQLEDKTVELVKGKGDVCFGVGTPVRALKWFEKYQEEHFGKPFNPVVRSFLIPLDVYKGIAERAVVQEQSSHPRYDGKVESTNVDIASETDQYETREADFKQFQAHAVSGSVISWALDNTKLEVPIAGEVRPIHELYASIGMMPFSGIFTAVKASREQSKTYDPFSQDGEHRAPATAAQAASELSEIHATYLERYDGANPGDFVQRKKFGGEVNDAQTRADNLDSFVRMHLFNPPDAKRLSVADRLVKAATPIAEEQAAKIKQAETWEQLKREAARAKSESGDPAPKPEPPEPARESVKLSLSQVIAAVVSASDDSPLAAIRADIEAEREEYASYLAANGQPVPDAWFSNLALYCTEVLATLPEEAKRYEIRRQRITAEHQHRDAELRSAGKPVPRQTDAEFFMRVLVPNAATQLEITAAIKDNTDEARSDLVERNPEYMRTFEQHWEDESTGAKVQHLPDTKMGEIDYAERKKENARVREGGSALTKLIAEPTTTAKQIVDLFLASFPELAEKFEEESNPGKYKFREHAERVIGQFLKHFRAGKHPLIGVDGMVKMILFHDMDKFRGRRLGKASQARTQARSQKKKKGEAGTPPRGEPEVQDLKSVVAHTQVSPAAVDARFDRRIEREKAFEGDPESASEHVLPAMMMERYGALWGSPDETRLAIALMDGDPIGALAKKAAPAAGALPGDIDKAREHAFREVIEMARRGGISPHDHAGVAAFYYQLLQFYQADSSSYSTEASHT